MRVCNKHVDRLNESDECPVCKLGACQEALRPFAHPDLNREQGGAPDLTSIIFQRGEAILTRGDCLKALEALSDE